MEADRRRSVRNVRRSSQPRSLVQRTLPEEWLIVLFLPNLHQWFIRLPPRREPPCLSSLRVSESTFVSLHIHSDVPWKRTSSATVVPACHWAGRGWGGVRVGVGRGRGCVPLNTVQRFSMSLIKTSYYQSDAEAFISKRMQTFTALVCVVVVVYLESWGPPKGSYLQSEDISVDPRVSFHWQSMWSLCLFLWDTMSICECFFFSSSTYIPATSVCKTWPHSVVLPITPVLLHLAYNSVCLFMWLWVSRKSNCRHHNNEATHMVAEELNSLMLEVMFATGPPPNLSW